MRAILAAMCNAVRRFPPWASRFARADVADAATDAVVAKAAAQRADSAAVIRAYAAQADARMRERARGR